MDPWRDFFGEDYIRFSRFILTQERTLSEIEGIQSILPDRTGLRVLDLGCGPGRIAVPLAQAGHDVVGLDVSGVMIDHARRAAAAAGVEVTWVEMDMRDLTWVEEFDAVLNVGTAFGYLVDHQEDQTVLTKVARALRHGGTFILDTENRERMISRFYSRPWFTLDKTTVWSERSFDPLTSRWREVLRWQKEEHERVALHDVRLYTATELAEMISAAGLALQGVFGSLSLEPYVLDSSRMVMVAKKNVIASSFVQSTGLERTV